MLKTGTDRSMRRSSSRRPRLPGYGKMDLMIGEKVVSPYEAGGLELIAATDEERADLARAGYGFRD